MRLSVGIPVYNEQQVLPELLARLTTVLDALPGGPHEMIFVDDGSLDDSRAILTKAAERDRRIRVIVLSRNFGHQAALSAALDHVTGDAVVLMDADLQDEPEVISTLLAHHTAGADVVYARRATRQEGLLLRTAYRVFYRVIASLAEVHLPRDAGDFALLGRPVIDAMRQLPEKQRYLRGLRAWVGFNQVAVDVQRPARFGGKSKYTSWKLVTLALDGICSFSVAPLRAAAFTGLCAIGLAVLYAMFAVFARVAGWDTPPGFTASLFVTTFLSGVQLVFLGIIGEYLGRVFGESKNRPAYVVAKVVGGD